jgi:hypothetical protein
MQSLFGSSRYRSWDFPGQFHTAASGNNSISIVRLAALRIQELPPKFGLPMYLAAFAALHHNPDAAVAWQDTFAMIAMAGTDANSAGTRGVAGINGRESRKT